MTDATQWTLGVAYALPPANHAAGKSDAGALEDLMELLRSDLTPDPEQSGPVHCLSRCTASALDEILACPDLYLAQLHTRSESPKEWTARTSADGAMSCWHLGADSILVFRYPTADAGDTAERPQVDGRSRAGSVHNGTSLWLVGGNPDADTLGWVPGTQPFPKGRCSFTAIAVSSTVLGKEDVPALFTWLRWSAVVRAWGAALDSLKTKRHELDSLTGWLRKEDGNDREDRTGGKPARRSFADMHAHVKYLEDSDSLLDSCYSLLVEIDRLKRSISWPPEPGDCVVKIFGQEVRLDQHFSTECAKYDVQTEDVRSSLELAKFRREQEAKHHEYAEKVLEISERYVRIRQAGVLASIVSLFMMLTLAATIDSVNKAISSWNLPLSLCGAATLWVFLLTLIVPLFGEGQLDRWRPMDYVLWALFCASCAVLVWACLSVWCSWPWAVCAPLGLVSALAVFVSCGPLRGRARVVLGHGRRARGRRRA